MRKCQNCGVEYDDNTTFCPKCGQRLESENVCQKCGYPVTPEDVFCGHCGYKIEKEYKCESCGAVISEDAKFCQECGAKVENPVVAVKKVDKKAAGRRGAKAPTTASGKAANGDTFKKIVFFAFGGVMIFLFTLMFIGCFGDIYHSYMTPRSSYGSLADSTTSIKYFFGDGIKQIKDSCEGLTYQEYRVFLIIKIFFEYTFWLYAITASVIGIVYASTKLYRGYKSGDYSINRKHYFYIFLGVLPYIFIFAIQCVAELTSSYDGDPATSMIATFGWGIMMIFVSLILALIFMIAQRILEAIAERKDIVKTSIIGGMAIVLFAVLFASFGKSISLYHSESGYRVHGDMTVFPFFQVNLLQYSADAIDKVSNGAWMCLFGSLILVASYFLGFKVVEILIAKPDRKVASIVYGSCCAVLSIVGSILSCAGFKALDTEGSGGLFGGALGLSEYGHYSGFGVAVPIIVVATIIALNVIQSINFGPKQEEIAE